MTSFRHIPSRRLEANSASHLRLRYTQACFPRADRNVTHNLLIAVVLSVATCTGQIVVILFVDFQLCKAHIVVILFVVFSSDVIISPYPLKMSPQNSASYFTLPRTQACFPRPIVLFCLGDGISLTASAYRGIQSNANSADRNVTYNLVVVFSSVKLKSYSFFS